MQKTSTQVSTYQHHSHLGNKGSRLKQKRKFQWLSRLSEKFVPWVTPFVVWMTTRTKSEVHPCQTQK